MEQTESNSLNSQCPSNPEIAAPEPGPAAVVRSGASVQIYLSESKMQMLKDLAKLLKLEGVEELVERFVDEGSAREANLLVQGQGDIKSAIIVFKKDRDRLNRIWPNGFSNGEDLVNQIEYQHGFVIGAQGGAQLLPAILTVSEPEANMALDQAVSWGEGYTWKEVIVGHFHSSFRNLGAFFRDNERHVVPRD